MAVRASWGAACMAVALLVMTAAPAQVAPLGPIVVAHGFGAPDDLSWGPHGSVYFSDFGDNAVNRLDPDGHVAVVWRGLRGPEGIVVQPDGSLVVAEQVTNRILHISLARHRQQVLATIPNPGGGLGIDGIARDPGDGSLVVPNAPSGTVLRVAMSGRVTVIATGLGRPVGALVLRNRSIVVVDEQRDAAFHIDASGALHPLGGLLSVPDDVVGDGGTGFYVSSLGDGTLRHIAADGTTTLVAAGLANPQGLLRRADGTLIVAEESANRIVAIHP